MRVVACPQCGTEVAWEDNPTRPFCSERCRLVDLGAWLDEKYTIPAPLDDESAEVEERPPATAKGSAKRSTDRSKDGHES